jgi:transcription antitermination protein NusB
MSTPTDQLRMVAYTGVYRLADAPQEEALSSVRMVADVDAYVTSLTLEQRDRVYHVAQRRLAMQLLYQLDATGERDAKGFLDRTLATVEGLGPVVGSAVGSLVLETLALSKDADKEFAVLAPEWPTHRLAGVDRAILRLAYTEIVRKHQPARIAINEAVELARAFSTDRSPAFINALLDKIAKAHTPAETE